MNIQGTIQHPSGAAIFGRAFAAAVRPRRALSVSEWADAHRIMTSKSSGHKGPWRTSLVPFAREPMDCLSVRSPIQEVTLMKPAQSAGTEIALNWIGYVMDHSPAPMLYVMPTIEVRQRFVKQRLDSMLIDTPVLAKIFDARRKRDSSNSESIKDFPGGILILSGANSPASLASMPIMYVVNDEMDRFPWTVGKEGDPDGLITQRQATFMRRKKLNISTPTMAEASRIEDKYNASDMRQFHVPCLHCGEMILFKWDNLQWDKTITRAWYVCMECGSVIEEHEKSSMLAKGKWIAKHPERSHLHRGYHWNALYAPLGLGFRWVELARQWKDAQDDHAKLKRFINTVLAETWEDRTRDVKPHLLMERAEPYKLRQVPPGCLILTAAIDVQDDRLELAIWGHGSAETHWWLDYNVVPGNPGQLLAELRRGEGPIAEYLNTPLRNAYGRDMLIQATGMDIGGHYTHEVYNAVRAKPARRLIAVQGANTPGKPILVPRPRAQDVNWRGKVIKGGVMLYQVGTDTAKHMLFNKLISDQGVEPEARKIHFSEDLPAECYDQLTAEVFDPEKNRFVKRRGRCNEGLDLFVYATAASQHPEIRVHAMRKRDWDRLAMILEPEGKEVSEEEQQEKPKAIALPPVTTKRRRVRSKGVGK